MPPRLAFVTSRSISRVVGQRNVADCRAFSYTAVSPAPLTLAFDLHEPKDVAKENQGPPIVFLHGLFGSKKNNRSMSKVLARGLSRPVYALDLRNHGDSPHDPSHTYTDLAEDVAGFLDQHKLEKSTLIGHSMGAKTAMTLALSSPSRVRNVIPVDNAPVDAALKSDFGGYVRGMRKVRDIGVTKQKDADEIMQEFCDELGVRQFLLTNLIRDKDTSKLLWRIPIDILARSLDHMADFPYKGSTDVRFNGPALFVRGTKSHYVADDTLPVIGQFFPRFHLKDIEAGHWVISENPEDFGKAVVEFLQEE